MAAASETIVQTLEELNIPTGIFESPKPMGLTPEQEDSNERILQRIYFPH